MPGTVTLAVGALGGWMLVGAGGSTTVDVAVEIAFDSGYTTPAGSRTWTDVTAYVEASEKVTITRGRPDQFSSPQASRLSLTLDNKDGRFTPENASGAYYPNVKKGRPIRVRANANGGGYQYRFLGYIDEWPVEWPGGSEAYSQVTVTATSRQARLGRTAPLRSIVEEEILYDTPVVHFPLGEPKGSTTAGNESPGRSEILTAAQSNSGGALLFGTGIGPGTDNLAAPTFAPAAGGQGLWLGTPLIQPLTQVGDHTVALEAWFTTTNPLAISQTLIAVTVGGVLFQGDSNVGYATQLRVYMDSSGTTRLEFREGPSLVAQRLAGGSQADGLLHHVVGILEAADAGTAKVKMILDGVDLGYSGTITWPYLNGGVAFLPPFTHMHVGGTRTNASSPTTSLDLWTGVIAHAAAYRAAAAPLSVARFAEHYNAASNGFAGEASGARIARYARLAGIPTAEISTETGLSTSIAHKDTAGELPSALMQDVATTEDGVVFDGKDGTLTFHARSHRYGATSAFILSVAAGDVEGGLIPKLDDQNLTNDMAASRPNGIAVRSTDGASIAEYGYYRETVEILTTSDNEVQSRADWQVNRFGTPRVTVPNLAVELLTCSSSLQAALLAADIGTKFTVTGLPSQAPASTMDFFVEGYTERIDTGSYRIELNVSAAAYANVFTLDSPTLGQIDSTAVLAY